MQSWYAGKSCQEDPYECRTKCKGPPSVRLRLLLMPKHQLQTHCTVIRRNLQDSCVAKQTEGSAIRRGVQILEVPSVWDKLDI